MRAEIAAADRRFAVRRAAAAWRKAGEIDAPAESAIAALYADDRVRTSPIFRALFFVFTWFGFSTAYGLGLAFLAAAGMDWESGGLFASLNILAGAVMLAVVEFLTAARRLRRFGIEEAGAWIGASYLAGGLLWLLAKQVALEFDLLLVVGAWLVATLATLVVWRWATPGMGFVAAVALFVGLSQMPANHLLCLLVAGLSAVPLATLSRAARISPEHRQHLGEAFVVAVVMFYFGVHVGVVESRLFALMRLGGGGLLANATSEAPAALVALSQLAMIAVPVLLLVAGVRWRFRPALGLGLVAALATISTFVARAHLQPVWLVLLVGGGLAIAGALLVRRLFVRCPGTEWRGLTPLALTEERESLQTLEIAATLATLTPAARQVEAGGFAGGGGDFGGGGASAKF